ncbi:hypothetical protein [Amycolatopsis sp. YIM 10]|uniref:hypothetical protein n=1 Tax=Amycolatopsis sp. YIM 10 TaxID=2653857 RepID=UPI00129066FE|nr:hypothetical protein [Amycolatopsis sp. YIM 10]QFU92009.1 hypothetical protein YIM_34240 [Amycolatopsis sp. YIM 10]
MRRTLLGGLALLLAGCGVSPSGITTGTDAPTGVAPEISLFFVDARQRLQPQPRPTGKLGTITEALALLLTGPGPDSPLHTEISASGQTRTVVDTTADQILVRLPLAERDLTALGVDQVVCTALGVHRQGGGSPSAVVRVRFTVPHEEPGPPRRCPVLPAG